MRIKSIFLISFFLLISFAITTSATSSPTVLGYSTAPSNVLTGQNITFNTTVVNANSLTWYKDGTSIRTDAFSSQSPTNLVDLSGNNQNGTMTSVTFGTDNNSNTNSSLVLDGSNSYVNLTTDSSLKPSSSITVSALINTADTKSVQIITGIGNTGLQGWSLQLRDNSANVYFYIKNGTISKSATKAYTSGTWARVVGVWDGSNIYVYVNGIASSAQPQTGAIDYTGFTTANVSIGQMAGQPTSSRFNGSVTNYMMWNRALSNSEILALDNGHVPSDGLVCWYNPNAATSSFTTAFASPETYNITAALAGDGGSYSKIWNGLIVALTKPAILGFTSAPTNIVPSQSITLNHTVLNANSVDWYKDGIIVQTNSTNSLTTTTAVDLSGNGENGTITSTTLGVDNNGNTNGSFVFDGSNSYINLPTGVSLKPTTAMTVSAYINTADTKGVQDVCGIGDNGLHGWNIALRDNSANVYFYVKNGAVSRSAVKAYPGGWAHIVAVYSGTGTYLSVNGVQVTGQAQSGAIDYTGFTTPAIGQVVGQSSTSRFNGNIANVMIWNRALSNAEQVALDSGYVNYTGLIAWYNPNSTTSTYTTSFATPEYYNITTVSKNSVGDSANLWNGLVVANTTTSLTNVTTIPAQYVLLENGTAYDIYFQGDTNISKYQISAGTLPQSGTSLFELFKDDWTRMFNYSTGWTVPRPAANLTTPSPDGTGEYVHPSIHRFDTPWHGYTYWLAVSPYYHATAGIENPCLLASNDKVNWVVPAGISNPLNTAPTGGYNSDPELEYNDVTDELWVYYRAYTTANYTMQEKVIKFNGATCTTPVIVYQYGSSIDTPKAESIVKNGSIWYDFEATNGFQSYVAYRTASDGMNWSSDKSITVVSNPNSDVSWHQDVQYISQKNTWVMLMYATNGLLFGTSPNPTGPWTFCPTYVAIPTDANNWDKYLYKSTFDYNPTTGNLEIFYTGHNLSDDYFVGYTQVPWDSYFNFLQNNWFPTLNGEATITFANGVASVAANSISTTQQFQHVRSNYTSVNSDVLGTLTLAHNMDWVFATNKTLVEEPASLKSAGIYIVPNSATNIVHVNGLQISDGAQLLSIIPEPIVVSFTVNQTSEIAPITVQFNDTSNGVPTSWLWDFGDGNVSANQNVTHTYARGGSYTVTLTANNIRESNTGNGQITVYPIPLTATVSPRNVNALDNLKVININTTGVISVPISSLFGNITSFIGSGYSLLALGALVLGAVILFRHMNWL